MYVPGARPVSYRSLKTAKTTTMCLSRIEISGQFLLIDTSITTKGPLAKHYRQSDDRVTPRRFQSLVEGERSLQPSLLEGNTQYPVDIYFVLWDCIYQGIGIKVTRI